MGHYSYTLEDPTPLDPSVRAPRTGGFVEVEPRNLRDVLEAFRRADLDAVLHANDFALLAMTDRVEAEFRRGARLTSDEDGLVRT